ncbi:MAG: hypothetical protein NFCOHLIN_00888 [Gammaproteobacteria bacterium]|nr:hypothetical protein [Gammaproteobacteria bacterium]
MKTEAAAGAWSEKKSSSNIEAGAGAAQTRQLLLLIGLGAAIPVLHALLHWPLRLPGHHGLEYMALMMFGRTVVSHRWAALTIAASAAATSFIPVFGFNELGMRFSFLLAGVTVDLLYRYVPWRNPVVLAAMSALAHATKPLWKWVAASGWNLKFGSMASGLGFPLMTHLCFGFVGGMIGVLLGRATNRMLKRA